MYSRFNSRNLYLAQISTQKSGSYTKFGSIKGGISLICHTSEITPPRILKMFSLLFFKSTYFHFPRTDLFLVESKLNVSFYHLDDSKKCWNSWLAKYNRTTNCPCCNEKSCRRRINNGFWGKITHFFFNQIWLNMDLKLKVNIGSTLLYIVLLHTRNW